MILEDVEWKKCAHTKHCGADGGMTCRQWRMAWGSGAANPTGERCEANRKKSFFQTHFCCVISNISIIRCQAISLTLLYYERKKVLICLFSLRFFSISYCAWKAISLGNLYQIVSSLFVLMKCHLPLNLLLRAFVFVSTLGCHFRMLLLDFFWLWMSGPCVSVGLEGEDRDGWRENGSFDISWSWLLFWSCQSKLYETLKLQLQCHSPHSCFYNLSLHFNLESSRKYLPKHKNFLSTNTA